MSARRATSAVLAAALLPPLIACGDPARIEIHAGVDVCHECQMIIDRPREAAGWVREGEFVPFDSPICLLRAYDYVAKHGEALPESLHFAVDDSGALRPAGSTVFLLTERRTTPMGGGVLAFADASAADAARGAEDEVVTDWDGFRLARSRPDRVLEVYFGPDGMVPAVVQAARGELLQWRAHATGLAADLVISVEGYPELEPVRLPASGEEIRFRLRAARPGDGFPVIAAGREGPLGRLRVSGPHTADEEAL